MNKKIKYLGVYPFILTIVIFLIFYFALLVSTPKNVDIIREPNPNPTPDYNNFDYHIWFASDSQPCSEVDFHGRWDTFLHAINNLSWDLGIFSGDLVNGATGCGYYSCTEQYERILQGLGDYLGNYCPNASYLLSHTPISISDGGSVPIIFSTGNHEDSEGCNGSLLGTYMGSNNGYNYNFGNIVFIMCGKDNITYMESQVINSDNITVVSTHYPYHGGWGNGHVDDHCDSYITGEDTYLTNNVLDLWVCGHSHNTHSNATSGVLSRTSCPAAPLSQARYGVSSSINVANYTSHNTTFLNDGCAEGGPGYRTCGIYDIASDCYFLCLNNNSKMAYLYSYVCTYLDNDTNINGTENKSLPGCGNQAPFFRPEYSGWIELSQPFIGPYETYQQKNI